MIGEFFEFVGGIIELIDDIRFFVRQLRKIRRTDPSTSLRMTKRSPLI